MTGGTGPAPGQRYAFLRTPRWWGLVAVVLLAAAVCVRLGVWQWERYEQRSAAVEQVRTAYDADPVPAGQLLGPGDAVTPELEWRPVRLTGRYLEDATVLLRNRPVAGTPAVHAVTPFLADVDGQDLLVVVNRGWLAADAGLTEEPDVPPAPAGEVSLVGRLRTAEAPSGRTAPDGQVYSLAAAEVLDVAARAGGSPVPEQVPRLEGHVQLVPGAASRAGAPEPLPPPGTDLGPHASYAVQWWIFAAGALVGLVVLARREARDAAQDDGVPPPRRRGGRAEDEEDALIEARLGRG